MAAPARCLTRRPSCSPPRTKRARQGSASGGICDAVSARSRDRPVIARSPCDEAIQPSAPSLRPLDCFAYARNDGGTSSVTSNHLFVYGTLMRGFDHPMAKLLSRSAEFCRDARCQGRLYLVKHSPGLVLSDETKEVVHGELFRLHAPEASFAILDDYEGCGPNVAEPQYLRQLLPVTCEDGSVTEAWTYVYNRPVILLKRIESGRFLKQ